MLKKTQIQRKPSTLVRKGIVKKKPGIGLQGSKLPRKASTAPKTKKVSKKKKTSRKELWGQYGLEIPKYIRYSGLQGVLWCVLSRYVRKTEFEQYGGKCVDNCGVEILDWHDADCGHFRSARSLSTRFLRENLAIQRKHCNSTRKGGGHGRQYDFGKEIDRRYGQGTADRLTELAAQTTSPFKDSWYDEQIRHYISLGDNPETDTLKDLQ